MGYEVKAPEWAKKYPTLGNFVLMFMIVCGIALALAISVGFILAVGYLLFSIIGGFAIPVIIVLAVAGGLGVAAANDDVFGLKRK